MNRARVALGVLLAAGLALCGPAACDRKTPSEKAITGASRQLGAVSVAGSSPGTAATYLEPKLTAVRRDVKELGSEPPAADTASASLISARASAGLAGLKAAQAAEPEGEARRLGLLVYATLDAYAAQASFAAGLEQFDPAPESKRLTDEVAAKEQEISKAAAAKRQLQDEAAKLEADTQTAVGSAQAERTTEAQIRRQAQDAAGQAKTDLITKANQNRRTADGHDKRAADLRSQSAVLAPRIEQAQGQLDHLTGQRKLLQDAIAEIQGLAQSSKQRATEARASVAKSAEDIAADLTKLEAARAEIDAPTKAAIDGYKSAAADARKASQGASREGKSAAMMAAGSYLANAGGVAASRADGFRAYAALLETLAATKPALANADKYTTAAAEARKGETEARDEAKDLLGSAKDAISGSGGDEAKALADEIGAAVEALSSNSVTPAKSLVLGGEATKGTGPGTPKPSGGGTETASGSEGEIRAMLSSLSGVLDSGDPAAIEKVIILPAGPLKDMIKEMGNLDKAFREKFKVSSAEAWKQAGLASTADEFSQMGVPPLAEIKIATTGADAGSISFSMMGMPVNVPVKKVDGSWALDLAGSSEIKTMLGMAGAMFAPATAKLKECAADVRAGKYPDAAAAAKAIDEQMDAMNPGGGG